jgi:hypothetical protein
VNRKRQRGLSSGYLPEPNEPIAQLGERPPLAEGRRFESF